MKYQARWAACGMMFLMAGVLGAAVLERSDVVFMYGAGRQVYEAYGATVLAWGGKARSGSAEREAGVRVFGSVGMVTEFGRYHDRFPDTYAEGLCRDVNGQPVKVPWLTDHQHKGIPFWWCCTRQPQFRTYLQERVVEVVRSGADGVHIDDHLGTAGGLWLGTCFCGRCVEGFGAYVGGLKEEERKKLGITGTGGGEFDYRAVVRRWVEEGGAGSRKAAGHPMWGEWQAWQLKEAAAFMQELHELANREAGRRLPMGANAGLLWPRHLADYRAIDLFSAETDHHASGRKMSDAPLLAYRLADAVGRPYAATASGGDWAFIKEQGLHGLVRGWIAFSYAAGHGLMAPNRQWCHTPEKGTHWYDGPAERFAPLYRFVRKQAALLDGYRNRPEVSVVMPHRSFVAGPERWMKISGDLSAAQVGYEIVLAGDEIVDHPLEAGALARAEVLLVLDRQALDAADRETLEGAAKGKKVLESVADVVQAVRPVVRVKASGPVRCLVREGSAGVVVHVVNFDYRAATDEVVPLREVELKLDTGALGLDAEGWCRVIPVEGEERELKLTGGVLKLEEVGLWTLVRVGRPGAK